MHNLTVGRLRQEDCKFEISLQLHSQDVLLKKRKREEKEILHVR